MEKHPKVFFYTNLAYEDALGKIWVKAQIKIKTSHKPAVLLANRF